MSSRPLIPKYPLDLSGTSPTNKVVAEIREINSPLERAIVPSGGPFYTDTFKIINADTSEDLIPMVDYVIAQPYQQAALRTGLDVQSVIVLKTTTPIRVSYDYQVVGGEFSWSIYALIELINELDLDNRPVYWGDIIGRPNAYPPAPHLHPISDTYGWEYVVWALEGIRNAILIGDEASHDELRAQMQFIREQLEAQIADLAEDLNDHIQDLNNPHNTTKAQVGLGNVENYLVATLQQAEDGTADNVYMTSLRVAQAIAHQALIPLNEHVNNLNNPHQTTKAQVGLGSVEDYRVANQQEAEDGTANNLYLTPLRVAQAITVQAGNLIQAHINDKTNPHNTTKAQVGLGSVENFGIATEEEAVTGAVNTKYMTPLRTLQAIDATIRVSLNNHINDLNNPHQTTKAQVGLGLIPNAITRRRDLNSDAELLTAGGMYDHVQSGDHDSRYVKINVEQNTSLRIYEGTLQGYISGSWRQLWPATWTNFVAPGASDPAIGQGEEITLMNAGGRLYASISGNWEQIWPPMWHD